MGNKRCLLLMSIATLLFAGCSKGTEQADEPNSAAVIADSAVRLETEVISNGQDDERVTPKSEASLDPTMLERLKEKKKESMEPIKGIVDTLMDTVVEDGKLNLNFAVHNISGDNVELSFGAGQQYDYVVYNSRNEEVYKWSNDKAFTLALVELDLKKGDSLSYAESWDLKDNDGNPVSKGAYTIKVWITAHVAMKDAKVFPEGMSAESAIELP
ncbi:BsuPI-related putative proteinase inhibitor [Cohnella mopanensis]|uniref:BsuPI-related putative proteinase inhibitor n=1 Tax=Cohnella mopanensis TaxID=2911966 RepID=UPI001EF875C0|nr:BsuPI-related putative proteinase inhibitor [Cohnella mopanensis]